MPDCTATGARFIDAFSQRVQFYPADSAERIIDAIRNEDRRLATARRLRLIWELDYPGTTRTGAAKEIQDALQRLERSKARFKRFPDSIKPAERRLLAIDEPRGWRAIADYLRD
jgi:hypothetical protein